MLGSRYREFEITDDRKKKFKKNSKTFDAKFEKLLNLSYERFPFHTHNFQIREGGGVQQAFINHYQFSLPNLLVWPLCGQVGEFEFCLQIA